MARNYHHGDLRQALLDATLQIVRTAGPGAVTLRDVAKRAGVSEAAPYHHFESKSHLLIEAAARGFSALGERLAAALEEGVTARERLIAIGAAYVRFALDEPGYFRLLFGAHVVELVAHPASEAARQAGRAAAAHLRRAVVEFHTDARARMPQPDLERIVWAQVHGLAWLVLEKELRPEPTPDEAVALAEAALAAILDGVSRDVRTQPQARPRRATPRATRRTGA